MGSVLIAYRSDQRKPKIYRVWSFPCRPNRPYRYTTDEFRGGSICCLMGWALHMLPLLLSTSRRLEAHLSSHPSVISDTSENYWRIWGPIWPVEFGSPCGEEILDEFLLIKAMDSLTIKQNDHNCSIQPIMWSTYLHNQFVWIQTRTECHYISELMSPSSIDQNLSLLRDSTGSHVVEVVENWKRFYSRQIGPLYYSERAGWLGQDWGW